MNFEKNPNTNEEIDVLENPDTEVDLEKQLDEEAKLKLAEEKEAEKTTTNELKEVDQQKASEEIEKTRKSIFGKIDEIFKGKEKTEEEKYEEEKNKMNKLILSLKKENKDSLTSGGSVGGGINFEGATSPQIRELVDEILKIKKAISKLPLGPSSEKRRLTDEKNEKISNLAKICKNELVNKYSNVA